MPNSLRVAFIISKQDSWNYHKYDVWKTFRQHSLLLLIAYTMAAAVASLVWVALFYLFVRDFWFSLTFGIGAGSLGMVSYGFSARQRHYKELAAKPGWIGSRFVELGKYDLRWGHSEETSRYYHWSAVTDIVETSSYFYLTVGEKYVFIVSKSAFLSSSDAQHFGMEMRVRWEAAKQKQRFQEQEVEGVWPPAPRTGV